MYDKVYCNIILFSVWPKSVCSLHKQHIVNVYNNVSRNTCTENVLVWQKHVIKEHLNNKCTGVSTINI